MKFKCVNNTSVSYGLFGIDCRQILYDHTVVLSRILGILGITAGIAFHIFACEWMDE